MPLPSYDLMLRSAAITLPLVGLGPAAWSACTNIRADVHPYTVNKSAFAFGWVRFSQVRKRPTSLLPLSSPRYMAVGRNTIAPSAASAPASGMSVGS